MARRANRGRGFWQRWEIVAYILDHYEGVEWTAGPTGAPRPVRQFMWADVDGEVWIGNSAAFAEHLAEHFGYELRSYDYVNVNRVLIDVGERIEEPKARAAGQPVGQAPMAPRKERVK